MDKNPFEYAPAPESRALVSIKAQYGLFINGAWVEPKTKDKFATINPANEEVLRNNVTKDKQSKYFINESATAYSLIPSLNIANIEKGILGNPIIAAISNKDIFYNTTTEQFENETLGSLGFTFEELINIWQTNLCYDLVQNSKQLDDEIWDLEEPELNTYLNRFTDVWTNLALALPTIYEEELSSYYFSIKGTSEGWDKIIASIKSKRKTIFKK